MTRKQTRLRTLEWQITRLEDRLAAMQHQNNRFSWLRLGTFAGGSLFSAGVMFTGQLVLAFLCFGVTLVVFGMVAYAHRRLLHNIQRHTVYLALKRSHHARMRLDWAQLPPALCNAPRADHPAELDLDLMGERALHRLLDTCVSREGSLLLRDWLTESPPNIPQTLARQTLVRELVPLWTFRDKLHLNAALSTRGRFWRWDGRRLDAWLTAFKPGVSLRTAVRVLTVLAVCNMVLFPLYVAGLLPPLWIVPFMLYAGLYLWHINRADDPFSLGLALEDPLNDLQTVFDFLENYPYGTSPALRALCAPFLDQSQRPSQELKQLTRVLAAASVRRNPILWTLISAVLPWDVYVMQWLDTRRAALVNLLPQWLAVWFQLEALSALANLGYLNPDYVFPIVTEHDSAPVLEGCALGHPLIPDDVRVDNDFVLQNPGNLVLITGSNMSGKSTFLRTVGVNLALAYAGGPVNARALHVRPLRVFTVIRVTDSLSDGISYFYAEVKRLKMLLDELEREHPYPVLFLIDEIFRGTNNRERLIGSRAYVRALAAQRGVGIISTHDLELVHLADDIPQIANQHFAETIADGRMAFDYTLRAGPCPTTNALAIMQMEGLPVDNSHSPPNNLG